MGTGTSTYEESQPRECAERSRWQGALLEQRAVGLKQEILKGIPMDRWTVVFSIKKMDLSKLFVGEQGSKKGQVIEGLTAWDYNLFCLFNFSSYHFCHLDVEILTSSTS